MIAIDHAGDQGRIASRKAGISVQVPVRSDAVGMQNDKRTLGPGIGEFADMPRLYAGGAVGGNHVPGRFTGSAYQATDVAQTGEHDNSAILIESRDGSSGAPGGT